MHASDSAAKIIKLVRALISMDTDRLLSPFLMWALVLAGASISFIFLPASMAYQPGAIHYAISAILLLHWLVFFISSMLFHKQAARSAAGIKKLATKGPYRFVRHPIYWADVVAFWGASIAHPAPWLFATAIWAAIVMFSWAALEERALKKRFGKAYSDYMKRTPMLLPDYHAAMGALLDSLGRKGKPLSPLHLEELL
jgi:protein-S-isoprenylcysteine O-methyltransferase Ste14